MSILEFLNLKEKTAKFRKIRIFEHYSALNYTMEKKFHMRRLNLNNKKVHLANLQLLNLSRNIAKFWKIRTKFGFKLLSSIRKFHKNRIDLNTQTIFDDFEIFN